MKFNVAWAKVASENHILKFVILCLGGLSVFFGITALKLALRDPLVIERGCYSKVAKTQDGKRTPEEIQAFLKEALAQRFDSNASVHDGYLSDEESVVRENEQKELQSRKLNQRVVLGNVIVNSGIVSVDADRLIAIGDVRSAFKFPLVVKLESVPRSEGNPYGLVISEVKTVQKGEKQ